VKVGIFHWAFHARGGGETVAYYMAKAVNSNVIYTLLSDGFYSDIKTVDLIEYIPRWARLITKVIKDRRAFEMWIWSLIDVNEIDDFDIIISSGTWTKAIITPEHVMHVHYLHSVNKYIWCTWHHYWQLTRRKMLAFMTAEFLRWMDRMIDSRVDYYLVNSELTRRRLWKYLKRYGEVLYPPIEVKKYTFKEYGDFFLHIGRFDSEKQIMPIIKACEKMKAKLILIGAEGNDRETLRYIRKRKNKNIKYLGYVDEKEKIDLLARCKAVIYNPINEDFGIVTVEALASGKPIIINNTGYPSVLIKGTGFIKRYNDVEIYKGGVITRGDVRTICQAIEAVKKHEWSPEIKKFAEPFDFSIFRDNLLAYLKTWRQEFDEMLNKNFER